MIATQSASLDWETISSSSDVDTQWGFANPDDTNQTVDAFTKYKFFGVIEDVPYVTLHERFFSSMIQDQVPAAKGDLAFIGVVNASGAQGFKDQVLQYELLIPASETYYLYLALQ